MLPYLTAPTATDFQAPRIEFIPREVPGHYVFRGVEITPKGLYLISLLVPSDSTERMRERARFPAEGIAAFRPNELGGLTIDFSDMVAYRGNEPFNAKVQIGDGGIRLFYLDHIARIYKGQEAVWMNPDLDEYMKERTAHKVKDQV